MLAPEGAFFGVVDATIVGDDGGEEGAARDEDRCVVGNNACAAQLDVSSDEQNV
jgi:hypothetical protein